MANLTLEYKYAVGSYEEFMNSEIAKETLPHIKAYDLETREVLNPSDYMPNIYRILMREYRNSEIAFEVVDDFLDKLWSTIENHVPNFIERYNRYQQYLKLTDEDLLNMGTTIMNVIRNTNDVNEEPLKEPLKNITDQTSSRRYADKASKIRGQIFNSQMTIQYDFLYHFKNLFMKLGTQPQYY